jgi:hypothetical protein
MSLRGFRSREGGESEVRTQQGATPVPKRRECVPQGYCGRILLIAVLTAKKFW